MPPLVPLLPTLPYGRRRELHPRLCETCGNQFHGLYQSAKSSPQRFCSRDCYYDYQRQEIGNKRSECVSCTKPFFISKKRKQFCSHSCFLSYKKRNKISLEESKRRIRVQRQGFYLRNRSAMLQRAKNYAERHPEKIQTYNRAYCVNHRGRINERRKQRLESDINFKLRTRITTRIWEAVRRGSARKTSSSVVLLGCTIPFLKGYLEARFQQGMTWENYGKWHIDHHIPCIEFDLRDPVQQRQCFHYSNLKPLWGKDNLSKGSKRPATHQAELI